MHVMAASGFIVLLVAKGWARPDSNGRLSLELGFDGIISNSNDLASHVLLLLPFLLYFALKPGRNKFVKVFGFAVIAYGCWVILGTSSRGTLLGLVGIALFLFFRASGRQRVAVMVAVPVLAIGLVMVLPQANIARLATVFGGKVVEGDADDEASASMDSRQYLVKQSIAYTFQHPLFGVGPSQFANFEGLQMKSRGLRGNWHETHNTYTQISSECGLPALLFVLAAFVGVFTGVNRSYTMARARGDADVAQVCLCYLASLIGYLLAITFLACAYRFTLPLLVGLGVAIHASAQRRMALAGPAPTAA
jgi:O-antigen ligase